MQLQSIRVDWKKETEKAAANFIRCEFHVNVHNINTDYTRVPLH